MAIDFYKRHGFRLVTPDKFPALLGTFWTISPRQIETSVVPTNAPRSRPVPING